MVTIARRQDGVGAHLKIAHEDVELAPKSPLLSDLDVIHYTLGQTSDKDVFHPEDCAVQPTAEVPRRAAEQLSEGHISLRATTSGHGTDRTVSRLQKDVGATRIHHGPPSPAEVLALKEQEQTILQRVRVAAGPGPHSQKAIRDLLPSWIVDKAVQTETSQYRTAVEEVSSRTVRRTANIVRSHFVYNIKLESGNIYRLKARLVPHGHRDAEKDQVRSDSSSASLFGIRLLLSLAAFLHMPLSSVDVRMAYLQARPLDREIFMIPPKGCAENGVFWKLIRPAYGITEAGRLWQRTINDFLSSYGFESIREIPDFFVLRRDGKIVILLAKLVDDCLLAGTAEETQKFYSAFSSKFSVGSLVAAENGMRFAGLDISQKADFSVEASMAPAFPKIILDPDRRRNHHAPCDEAEILKFREMCGSLVYPGSTLLPQAAVTASLLQQKLPNLTIKTLKEANAALSHLSRLRPTMSFPSPKGPVESLKLLSFSDASHGEAYGQTGFVIGLYATMCDNTNIFHTVDFGSKKQRRVSFSSLGAEILAAADASDRGIFYCQAINSILKGMTNSTVRLNLLVDSRGLFDTLSTLHEGRDYRLRGTVARLRDSFASHEIAGIRWIRGIANLADALTKPNFDMWQRLNKLLCTGVLDSSVFEDSLLVDSQVWR